MKRLDRLGLIDSNQLIHRSFEDEEENQGQSQTGPLKPTKIGKQGESYTQFPALLEMITLVKRTKGKPSGSKKEKDGIEIRKSHLKPSKFIGDEVRITEDGKWVNIKDIFIKFRQFLTNVGVKFI